MTEFAGRLIAYDDELHLEVPRRHTLAVGDRLEMIRGNGPREGEPMGTATVTAFEDGLPVFVVHPGDAWRRRMKWRRWRRRMTWRAARDDGERS